MQEEVAAATPAQETSAVTQAQPQEGSERFSQWRSRIDRCKAKKNNGLLDDWRKNVDYRRAKGSDEDSDSSRVRITIDWAQTKAKQAQLFSQVPQVMGLPKHPAVAPVVAPFIKRVNSRLEQAKVGVAMDECVPDAINAAGIGVALVSYEARTELKQALRVDTRLLPPDVAERMKAQPELMDAAPLPVDKRFTVKRISPADFLWPIEFTGSDFDQAPWLGHTRRATWDEALHLFQGKLTELDKDNCLCGKETKQTTLSNSDNDKNGDELVEFDEVFYWAYLYDQNCTSFCKIRRVVFVRGKKDPVVDEDWKGQKLGAQGTYVGATEFPIRVLTLTYLTDEAIPPSDTAMGRPQVDEMVKSRQQMYDQREYSKPIRWFDVNRVDPQIIDALMQGTWQGMVPTNGDGTKAVGEVARASYPKDDHDIDRILKEDHQNAYGLGPNQASTYNAGERSAAEAQIVQANFSTRIGYERARVVAFFVGIARVMAGLMALYDDFNVPEVGEDGAAALAQWDRTQIATDLVYTVRADSTVLLDSAQKTNKLMQFLNMVGKSGYINVEPVVRELAALAGLNPDQVVRAPQPQGPEAPKISFAFKGEDITQVIPLAVLMEAGMAPKPETIAAVLKLLAEATSAQPGAPPAGGAPGGQPGGEGNQPPPEVGEAPPMEDNRPEWQMVDKVNARRNDGSQ